MATETGNGMQIYHGVGKRKTAVARVWLRPGEGNFTVNRRSLEDYFPPESLRRLIDHVFEITDTAGKFDVTVNVRGGGISAQAQAIRHGLARALVEYDEGLRGVLKRAGYLTRDAREKERKKYGLRKARASFQWTKR